MPPQVEYTFEDTGTRVVDYGNGHVGIFVCTDRTASEEQMEAEATWLYVAVRMVHEKNKWKEITVLIDLHKIHVMKTSRNVREYYKNIMKRSMSFVKKISIVGDMFQCALMRGIMTMLPLYKKRVRFFMNFKQAKQWLHWI